MEKFARDALVKEWPTFRSQEKSRCAEEANSGPASYVLWLTCLKINANARSYSATQSTTPGAETGGATGRRLTSPS